MTLRFSLIAAGSVAFRGSYDQCLAVAVDRGLAEVERRIAATGEAVDRFRLGERVHMTLTASEGRFTMRRAA